MAATVQIPARKTIPQYLAPYRRITTSGQFIPEIDGLRFIAIFFVFVYHLGGDVFRHSDAGQQAQLESDLLYSITHILTIGVPLFFVISGFILGLPFAEACRNLRKPVSLKKYFWRRVTRLEPPYILSMFLFFFLKIAESGGAAVSQFPNLLASLFYVHNAVFGRISDINGVAWSLEVEIQFYILAPVLALLFAIRKPFIRRGALAALTVVSIVMNRVVAGHVHLQYSILGYAQYFLAGFLLVEFYLAKDEKPSSNTMWDLVSLIGWPLFIAVLLRGDDWMFWLSPGFILLLYIAAIQGVVVRRFITNPWISSIGGMCYSIYLLHNYGIAALGQITERLSPTGPFGLRLLIQLVLMGPVLLAISAIYFRFIERPCMRPDWVQRLRVRFWPQAESASA